MFDALLVLQHVYDALGLQIKDTDGTMLRGGDDQTIVGGKGDICDTVEFVAAVAAHQRRSGDMPHLNGFMRTRAESEERPIWGESHCARIYRGSIGANV